MIFADATRSGAIEEDERAIMAGIMKLASRPVRELMTPRTELDWLEKSAGLDDIREAIDRSPHSLLPVADGSPDKVVGIVKVRELLAMLLAGKRIALARDHAQGRSDSRSDRCDGRPAHPPAIGRRHGHGA